MKKAITVFLVLFILAMPHANASIINDFPLAEVEVFQVIDSEHALALSPDYNVVMLLADNCFLYDGKKFMIDENNVIDTYTYKTNAGYDKTIPVYKVEGDKNKEMTKSVLLSFEIFQTIDKEDALAILSEDNSIIKIETKTDLLFDGKKMRGFYTLYSTYSYEARSGAIKTVPVYIKTSELKQMLRFE